jgi:hypothetical protein
MCAKVFCVSIVSVVAAICASAFAAEQGTPEAATRPTTTCNRVVVVEGDSPAKVNVGDIVRVRASGPSGMVEITARTEGPVKLVRTNDVRRVVNGGAVIGEMIREFEVKAKRSGSAKVVVTIDNRITKKAETRRFKLEVR